MDELTDFEKLMESVNQLAVLVKAYCNALVEQGFGYEEAILLTKEYQKSIIELAKPSSK